MTHDRDKFPDGDLEAFFRAARDERVEPSPDLLARVLGDAYAAQGVPAAPAVPASAPRRGRLRGLFEAVGGWPAAAGLVTAAAAGLWLGYSPPVTVETLSLAFLDGGNELTMGSSLPDIDFLLTDG